MSGTKTGGLKAAITNKLNHGDDFYKTIGSTGGKASGTGGFYNNPELARIAGRKGGYISRRTGQVKPTKQFRIAEETPNTEKAKFNLLKWMQRG